jgi:putative tryptophan/tyrosine transport system substrate-binding protein
MRRRDFTIGVLLATATRSARAQQSAKQRRIAIVIPAGGVADISETGNDALGRRLYQPFFEELRRLGEVEGQNLTIERYSAEGRSEDPAELARAVVSRNPDVIVAVTNPTALAIRAATSTIPIVWIGADAIRFGLVTNLARPGGNITGVSRYDLEFYGKLLQLLKEVVPSASRLGWLTARRTREGTYGQVTQWAFQDAAEQLGASLVPMLVQESTESEYRRVFAEIAPAPPDALAVSDIADLFSHSRLIVALVEKTRLPAIYGYREYVEAGGLMAYGGVLGELGRRMADDVHEILNGAKPGDIPIYQQTEFALIINLKAAEALGLTMPPSLLARADDAIE